MKTFFKKSTFPLKGVLLFFVTSSIFLRTGQNYGFIVNSFILKNIVTTLTKLINVKKTNYLKDNQVRS